MTIDRTLPPLPLLQPDLIVQYIFRDCNSHDSTRLSPRPSLSQYNKSHTCCSRPRRQFHHHLTCFQRLKTSEMVMGLSPRSLTNGVGCPCLGFIGGLLLGARLAQTWPPQTPGVSSSQEEFSSQFIV